VRIAQVLNDKKKIPITLDKLTELPGIGRKSANVIIREAGGEPEGIIVDLHVLRVVPRLGITAEDKPDKIEKALMELIPKKYWNAAACRFPILAGNCACRQSRTVQNV